MTFLAIVGLILLFGIVYELANITEVLRQANRNKEKELKLREKELKLKSKK